VLDGTPVAHLASVLPDGAPHAVPVWIGTEGDHVVVLTGPDSRKARNLRRDPRVALALTPVGNPLQPVIVRGRVVEWIEGDAAWEIIDRIAEKYIGGPYARGEERVVALIEPDRQSVG
jgi:PPOX class probable F420-dependent enzyme